MGVKRDTSKAVLTTAWGHDAPMRGKGAVGKYMWPQMWPACGMLLASSVAEPPAPMKSMSEHAAEVADFRAGMFAGVAGDIAGRADGSVPVDVLARIVDAGGMVELIAVFAAIVVVTMGADWAEV